MIDAPATAATLLRNEPVQARSTARLTSLLDAAAAVVDERGYERLTTAMVAERAGSSIGTVYRYFPDRIAVLQALSARSLAAFENGALENIGAQQDWRGAVSATLDYLVEAFRSESGFCSLRFGDVLDLRPHESGRTNYGAVAASVASLLVARHSFTEGPELTRRVESALLLADALLTRAFTFGAAGEEQFIGEARDVAMSYLERAFGD